MLDSQQQQQQRPQQQQQLRQQQVYNYQQQDYTNQLSNMSLEDHTRHQQQQQQTIQQSQQHKQQSQHDTDNKPAQQVPSPASPTDISPTPVNVYFPGGHLSNSQQYVSGYHMPVYHSGGYQTAYQDPSQFSPQSSPLTQPPQQHQLQSQVVPQQMTVQRQRFVQQKMLPYREGNKLYVATPNSNPNQMTMAMLVRSPHQEVVLQNYAQNKSGMNIGTTALPVAGSTLAEASAVEYVKRDVQTYAMQQQQQQQQGIFQLNQQQRSLMHFQPTYQHAYAYMSHAKK